MKLHLSLIIAVVALCGCTTGAKRGAEVANEPAADSAVQISPLHVEGTQLVDSAGNRVVLTGASLGWHSLWGRFYNPGTVKALKENWGANVTRAAIGAHSSGDVTGCFDRDSAKAVDLATTVIDAAIDNGMYVICDWHSHENTLDDAKKFFGVISGKYGDCPNIIYEIWNEPLEIEWQEIKDYAAEVIPVIRRNAPGAVVIVGTPKWDQQIDVAAESPIDMPNLLYALHFYAATHKEWLRDNARAAIGKGLPLIISECGGMEHTGDGPLDEESFNAWVDLADEHGLSMLYWDIADKAETCSMIEPTAADNGMQWTDSDLRPWAKLAKETIQRRNGIKEK